jgi:hypothetical protein
MTTYNINITTPNSGNIYFVKADVQPTYDYIQCPTSEATHLAVLRYVPQASEIVAGEVYADLSALVSFIKFPITYSYVNVNQIDIFIKKTSESTAHYKQVGKNITATGTAEFSILPSDFSIGDDITIKIQDSDDVMVQDTIESHIYAVT